MAMDESNDSLGFLIRTAREHSGRQLSDIAAELHINAAHLQALENEELDKLPSPSFAKGYIRAYARALEIDPGPLLKAYLRAAPPAPVWQANQTVVEENAKSLAPVVLITAIVVATLVALFVVWFANSGYLDKESTVVDDSTPVVETEASPASVTQTEIEVGNTAADSSAVAREEMEAEPASMENSADGKAASGDEAGAAEPEKQAAVIEEAPKKPVASPAASSVKEKKAGETAKASTRLAPSKDNPDLIRAPEGSDKVVISLSDDSWVEITDANGQRLLRGLYLKEARKTLIGKAPFQVFLGNAPAVTLQAGGKPFDVKRYLRPNKTARFAVLKQ
ncbi:MAG TPA: helix-turn-helix domain-containing protein [Gammaproteobacteria bacterium]|nr:helix-turn-helix domain-containing protein [Gammaproteobacteria bacterium]